MNQQALISDVEIPYVALSGYDQGAPSIQTELSGGHDLPIVLTRACMHPNKKRFFNWNLRRFDAHRMPPTPSQDIIPYENIVQYLNAEKNAEYQAIKQGGKGFPYQKLKLKIRPGERIRIPLGFKAALPQHLSCLLMMRSSCDTRGDRLSNCVGLIDPDYPGEWFISVINEKPKEDLILEHGQRLVQAVLIPRITATWKPVKELPSENVTSRTGGFGTTEEQENQSVNVPQKSQAQQDVENMFEEPSPEEDAALDKMLAEADAELLKDVDPSVDQSTHIPDDAEVPTSPSAPVAAPTSEEVIEVKLKCGELLAGPVAKLRPEQHRKLFNEQGAAAVVSVLQRELNALAPKALNALVASFFGPPPQ